MVKSNMDQRPAQLGPVRGDADAAGLTSPRPFHGGNTGSIPVGRANEIKHLGGIKNCFPASYGTDTARASLNWPVCEFPTSQPVSRCQSENYFLTRQDCRAANPAQHDASARLADRARRCSCCGCVYTGNGHLGSLGVIWTTRYSDWGADHFM
jgi:hypothetical protein